MSGTTSTSRGWAQFGTPYIVGFGSMNSHARYCKLAYAFTDIFTAVGILLHIGAARGDIEALEDSPSNLPELRTWALTFLDRWSSSSTLAARYVSLLRHSERRLADKNNHRPIDTAGLNEGSLSSDDPFDAMTAFPDVDSTFLWTSDANGTDPEAWRWDSGMWNIDYQALSQGF